MKKLFTVYLVLFLFSVLNAQTVTGRLVNQNGDGFTDLQVKLYIGADVYTDSTSSDGSFSFNNVTAIEDNLVMPTGYSVSNNYPNPFNPKTRINITLPQTSRVNIEIFNVLGQNIKDIPVETFSRGVHTIDIEMNGLSNGIYIAKITIDDKYSVIKKLMLVYGSQQITGSNIASITKTHRSVGNTKLDSIVASGTTIFDQVFKNLPTLQETLVDVGNLVVTNTKTDSVIDKTDGGIITTPQGAILTIPPNALPASGNVYIGHSGNEPTSFENNNLDVVGNSLTIGLPVDSLLSSIQLSFQKPTISVPLENYCLFLYNGQTYFPIEYSISNDTVNASIDNINWETSLSLNKELSTEDTKLFSEIIIIGLILKQTPPDEEMGLKQIALSQSGDLIFSTPTANSSSKILLLVHGWISRPGVWETMIQRINNETDPAYTNIWTFGYNSSLSVSSNGVLLAQSLQQYTNGAKVDIVAHSMGGLVSRSMIEYENGAQYVNKLITLGTPNKGSPLAAIRGFIGAGITTNNPLKGLIYNYFTQGFRDLGTNSSFIQKMETLITPPIPYYLIAATNDPTKWWVSKDYILPGLDDGIVTVASALGVSGAISPSSINIPVKIAHTKMTEENSVYQQVLTYLRENESTGTPCPGTATVTYAGKTYNTVQIGTQCWLKENLDVGTMITSASSTDDQTDNGIIEKYCYDNNPANCATYGGLYQWDEAMQYVTTEGTQGICPSGWHIPTRSEFETLKAAVNNDGNALKAIGQGAGSGTGTNTSGFTALLVGARAGVDGKFYNFGDFSLFWISTQPFSGGSTYYLYLNSDNDGVYFNEGGQSYGYSVRCLKDDQGGSAPNAPSLSSPDNGATNQSTAPTLIWNTSSGATSYTLQVSTNSTFSSFVYNQSALTDTSKQVSGLSNTTTYYWRVSATNSYGTSGWSTPTWSFTTESGGGGGGTPCSGIPTVTYAGKTYNTVQIGNQCWLKENLDVGTMIQGSQGPSNNNTIEKYCYDNDPNNCNTYGGLYEWNEAMQYVTTEGAQGICPSGWHIPTFAELLTLATAVNNNGNVLKAIGQGSGNGAGTNTSGFSGLLAGSHYSNYFTSLGDYTIYWSSSVYNAAYAKMLELKGYTNEVIVNQQDKLVGNSIRCLKDDQTGTAPNAPLLSSPDNGATNQSTSPTFIWNTSSGATSYTLQVSTSSSFTSFAYNQSGLADTSKQVTGLSNSTEYYWQVSATNSYGTSGWSTPTWSFTTVSGNAGGTPCPGTPTVTYAGKTYNTVQIGDQCWLKENLDIGTMIQGSENATNNGIIEKYCLDNDPVNCTTYGSLYQWDETMQYNTNPGTRGICPSGWHLPTVAEFQTLIDAVGGSGNALKAIGQGTGNGAGTNTSGFSALLGGFRSEDSNFWPNAAGFWTSQDFNTNSAYILPLFFTNDNISYPAGDPKGRGHSVRCLKD